MSYKIRILCRNCDAECDIDILKGREAPTLLVCSVCGCETAWKKEREISKSKPAKPGRINEV